MVVCGGCLVWAGLDLPAFGDPQAPAAMYVSPYYIEHTIEDAETPNVVTTVLADYRGFDTMFETSVVLTAGLACLLLLRVFSRRPQRQRLYRHVASDIVVQISTPHLNPDDPAAFERLDALWTPHDLIIRTACRLLVPFIQLFALYVIAHGHHSPGGGFQGGVILGAAFILIALSYDLRTLEHRINESMTGILSPAGVFIYAGVGAVCMLLGSNFLDYGALAGLLSTSPARARSLGILFVEIGVAIAVMATMALIYTNLSSAGRHRQGL